MNKILCFVFLILHYCQETQPKKFHPCNQRSCYPSTGNLLIGRENHLKATSTCGLKGAEKFCIISGWKDTKQCFFCNAADPKMQHNIENILGGNPNRTWWQAENGVENVTIQIDFEAEFDFTQITINFPAFRPAAMLIERSFDFGRTWQVYKYFAENCQQSFPGIPLYSQKLGEAICETRNLRIRPQRNDEIDFSVIPSNVLFNNRHSKKVQNLLKITNLRINFSKLYTFDNEVIDNQNEIREKYYYAIRYMVIRGSCSCNGHASKCLPLNETFAQENMIHARCECIHNTSGINCEQCRPSYYHDVTKDISDPKACQPCDCNPTGSLNLFCDKNGGTCPCKRNVVGRKCDRCAPGTYGFGFEGCKP